MVRLTRRRTVALLGSSIPVSLLAGSAVAATDGSVAADPSTAGATATHAVTVTVDGDAVGSSWNSLVVDYSASGADVSDVGTDDLTTVGIDRGDDADGTTVDDDVSADVSSVSASNDGSTLTVGLGGNYSLGAGDELVAVYGDVQNPDATGSSNVTLTVNQQSADESTAATLETTAQSDGDDSDDDSDGQNDGSDGQEDDGCNVCASVTFDDQVSAGDSVVVADAFLPEGGYVVIHRADGTVIGNSAYLDAGGHEDVTVTLSSPIPDDRTLTAMAHRETNGNESYEFPDADGPYTCDGSPVVCDGEVTVETC